ncbi:type VI secretion system-associated protein TagF [Beijerinckia mobilis]|uniref:type VI secretion system-associated protein TagF n=1 Tax=Beijerinckia mobilis TaxID=231434 RepID=UPI0005565A20|nr:type VI secretion system-associated protein TagF [Beijerinckia mobilis]
MRRGLFGKVLSKRDFIAHGVTRGFLTVFEPWLQRSLAASRAELGDRWPETFLTAPIWRFWLGANLCDAPAVGALMPSMDGIGRCFPLVLAMVAENGEVIASPESGALDSWFAAVETYLLETLDDGALFETILQSLADLPPPPLAATRIDGRGTPLPGIGAPVAPSNPAASYWSTVGGGGYESKAFVTVGMPEAGLFATMITGRFETSQVFTG